MFRKIASAIVIATTLATASATVVGSFLTAAHAASPSPSQGVVLVPASYSEALAPAKPGQTLYDFGTAAPVANDGFSRAQIVNYPPATANGSIVAATHLNRL